MTMALSARHLEYVTDDGTSLLRDAHFDLPEKAVLAIAGPNGAGKTTLLNLLCGAVPIKTGDVLVQGQSLRRFSAMERARQIAVVGQQEQPDGRLRLRDYVALGQIPIQADFSGAEHAAHLTHVLHLTGLALLADKRMGTLSGGERQRAHVARALAQRPSLLFLDEPTNHLDPDAKGRVLSLVASLEVTVVMVVHDLVLIPEFASHIALMKNTTMTGFGPVRDILTPARVRDTFGVTYLSFAHEGRMIPALDIRKTPIRTDQRSLS